MVVAVPAVVGVNVVAKEVIFFHFNVNYIIVYTLFISSEVY